MNSVRRERNKEEEMNRGKWRRGERRGDE